MDNPAVRLMVITLGVLLGGFLVYKVVFNNRSQTLTTEQEVHINWRILKKPDGTAYLRAYADTGDLLLQEQVTDPALLEALYPESV